MSDRRYFVWAAVAIGVLALLFVLFVLLRVSTGGGESINLAVSPTSTEAIALAGAQSAGAAATSGTHTGTGATSNLNDPIAFLRTLPQASTFVSLLDQSGVTSELSTNGTYTFFVPTNAAFAASSVGPIANLTAAEKKRLAEFHLVSGKMMSINAIKSGFMTMLSRDDLNAIVFNIAQVGGNTHILATYHVPNGIVYLTDIVLLPPVRRPFPF